MAGREKQVKELQKIIAPYGLTITRDSHRRIRNAEGKLVYSFSGSPSAPYFAKNTLMDLIKMGVVPSFEKEKASKLI